MRVITARISMFNAHRWIVWLPAVVLPAAVLALAPSSWDRWAYMWLIAVALYGGAKWLTWMDAPPCQAPWTRHVSYLLAWPGLDASAFLCSRAGVHPSLRVWLFAWAKLAIGTVLFASTVFVPRSFELLRGWIGMIAIVFILHFGIFHLLSLMWRTLGMDAKPIQNWPMLATSVSDFWAKRWNTAFRDLTHRYLFRPLTARLGGRAAILVGFLFSGLLHELVISVPAGTGYGGPTLYFLIQSLALLFERSAMGRRLGLGRGVRGWAFTMLALLGPVALLFHPPFVRTIIVPFVDFVTGGFA